MKTPHRLELFYETVETRFNPISGEYETGDSVSITVPCLITFPTQQTIFEQYGTRDEVIMSARFNFEVEPFELAVYEGRTFKPIEKTDAPMKDAVRLREVDVHEA